MIVDCSEARHCYLHGGRGAFIHTTCSKAVTDSNRRKANHLASDARMPNDTFPTLFAMGGDPVLRVGTSLPRVWKHHRSERRIGGSHGQRPDCDERGFGATNRAIFQRAFERRLRLAPVAKDRQYTSVIHDLPAANDYAFTAEALDKSGNVFARGMATKVAIATGVTAKVIIYLNELAPTTPFGNASPRIDGIAYSPAASVSAGWAGRAVGHRPRCRLWPDRHVELQLGSRWWHAGP
jgi:hypothetical protein